MALHKRIELEPVLGDIRQGSPRQVYLCFGERYLCQQAADKIGEAFLQQGNGAVHALDGSSEDTAGILSRLLSFSLLPGIQIYRVSDTRLFLSRKIGASIWDKAIKAHQGDKRTAAGRHLANLLNLAGITPDGTAVFSDISADQWQKLFGFSHPAQDLSWADKLIGEAGLTSSPAAGNTDERLISAIKQGFPDNNILLLITENVDKRKKLFTQIKKHGEIIDCSVADGSSRAAVQEQKDVVREMARKTLAEFDKTIEPKALEFLFARVGFHPVAVVMEMEKLALYVDDRPTITVGDLDHMVSRTKEDAIFELTEAFGKRNRANTLIILNNLLKDGVHSLAILASMRNYLRKLLVFRSLQSSETPVWQNRMNAGNFQKHYLPALKDTGAWPELLKGHPYALFMSFSKAAEFSTEALKQSLSHLLEAEFRLKGSPLPPGIVLEELLLSLIKINSGRKSTFG